MEWIGNERPTAAASSKKRKGKRTTSALCCYHPPCAAKHGRTNMFPILVARTSTIGIISSGPSKTRNGTIQMMVAELQMPFTIGSSPVHRSSSIPPSSMQRVCGLSLIFPLTSTKTLLASLCKLGKSKCKSEQDSVQYGKKQMTYGRCF